MPVVHITGYVVGACAAQTVAIALLALEDEGLLIVVEPQRHS